MNLFLDDNDDGEQPQLRDSLTEGYNPIPNFFISARIPNKKEGNKFLSFEDAQLEPQVTAFSLIDSSRTDCLTAIRCFFVTMM